MSKRQKRKQQVQPVQPTQESPAELQHCQQELKTVRQELQKSQDREGELQKREENLDRREATVKEDEQDLKKREGEVSKRQSAVTAREGEVAERERVVSERELEADAGFERRNRESLKKFEGELAALRGQLEEMRTAAFKKLKEEYEARKAAQDEALDRSRERDQARLDADFADRRKRFDAEIARERADIEQQRASVGQIEKQQAERENQLIVRERKVAADEAILREDRENLKATIESRVDERVADFKHQLAQKDVRIERLVEQRDRFEQKVNASEDWRRRFGHKEPEEWLDDFDKLGTDRDRLRAELAERPSLEDGERLAGLEEDRRQREQKHTEMARELAELRARESDWLMAVDERERLKDQKEVAERRRETLQAEMEKLREDVIRLRSLYEQPKEREARVGVIEQPRFEKKELPQGVVVDPDEVKWIESIHERCGESGLSFPRRLLYAFHTSLKTADWTPLTVLGGVSGTGKSELPRLYARFGGLAFEPLSVQPNWDSPQSMFGFFNSVDNRFNATPLLRALVQSQQASDSATYADGMRDRLLLVLLDEMNLSHVELYFSDLLSKLELRRGETNGVNLEVDLGAGLEEYPVPLGRNVLWVGTMNEDETTKTLSDKVLDRANLIGFPRPQELKRRREAKLADPQPMLERKQWNKWLCQKSDLSKEEVGKYKETVEKISHSLEHAGRALGHRVWQAIESYMANYPGVRNPQAEDEARPKALRHAFEDALVHKVMPKLRGIETSGTSRSECLDPIGELLSGNDLGLRLSEDFELACSVGYAFAWRSAKYLEADQ